MSATRGTTPSIANSASSSVSSSAAPSAGNSASNCGLAVEGTSTATNSITAHDTSSTPQDITPQLVAEVNPVPPGPLIVVTGLVYRYGDRTALDGLDLSVAAGTLHALLGPNGSGKTTLFRILSTAVRPQGGHTRIGGSDLITEAAKVRHQLGVVFQSPSLDPKLTVAENLRFHGLLFGMRGRSLKQRAETMLERFGIAERRGERVETLSGGLKRRVELAKALLPEPPLLLLDEPSTGLDPAARLEFWTVLEHLRKQDGLTVVVATHLMDEAERCDWVSLLDQGRLVTEGAPEALKREVGGDILTIEVTDEAADTDTLATALQEQLGLAPGQLDTRLGGRLRFETQDGATMAMQVMERFADRIRSLTLGRPTLEDVFLAQTGHRLSEDEERP